MDITVDAPNSSVTVTFDSDEWKVMQKVQQQSPGEFKRVLVVWLKDQGEALKQDLRRIVQARIETATIEQLQEARKALGL